MTPKITAIIDGFDADPTYQDVFQLFVARLVGDASLQFLSESLVTAQLLLSLIARSLPRLLQGRLGELKISLSLS